MKTNRNTLKMRKSAGKSRKKTNVRPFTEFEGELYTGIPVKQAWALNKGKWEEQRTGPQSWDFAYETIAVKPGKLTAGLPIGSEYHSYVLAHQKLVKTRNNTYQLRIEGVKFKLAHKEAGERWSANAAVRKKSLINMLKQVLNDLEMGHGKAPSETKRLPAGSEPAAPGQSTRKARRKKDDTRV